MAEFVDPNELFYTQWEPKLRNRFIMEIDGVPTYLIRKTTRPSIETTEIEIPHINVSRYAKGKSKWSSECAIELWDPIVPSGAQIMMEWLRLSHESITGRDGYFDFFAKDVTINVLDPVGGICESWTLKGAWPKSIDFGDMEYASEGDLLIVSVVLKYNFPILNF
jgi:hypothetical protein